MGSKEIRELVDAKLLAIGVGFSASYAGETVRDNDWKCDAWRVTFQKEGKKFKTDYYTGLGHRKEPKLKPWSSGAPYRKGTLAYEQYEKTLKAVAPSATDVLHSLVLDAEAAHQSFNDWCSNYGYDNDSIKAFKTYQACCEIGEQLRVVFTREDIEAIRELTQDL